MFIRRKHVLQAPAGEADGGGGDDLSIIDDDPVKDDPDTPVDRGDDPNPAIDPKNLKKVAGEDTVEGGQSTVEGASGDDHAGKKGSQHVPIGRFNEVNEEKKRLERENAELRAAGKPAEPEKKKDEPPKFDEDKAEMEYANLLAGGDFDKAVALRKDINKHVREQARQEAEANVETRISQRSTAQLLDAVATKAVADFPYLDTEDGQETMTLIVAARDGYVARGMPIDKALQKAVDSIAPKFAPQTDTPGKGLAKDPAGTDTRSQAAAKRGAEASGQQPPRLDGGAGSRATQGKVNVEDLTEDQFDALSPQEKSRLRGDA